MSSRQLASCLFTLAVLLVLLPGCGKKGKSLITPPLEPPRILSVAPTGEVGSRLGGTVTVSAQVEGEVTAWQWVFSGPVEPRTSTAATPVLTVRELGTIQAQVTTSNAAGSSPPLAFSWEAVRGAPPDWELQTLAGRPGTTTSASFSVKLIESTLYMAWRLPSYSDGTQEYPGQVRFAWSDFSTTTGPANTWVVHSLDDLADVQLISEILLFQGRLVALGLGLDSTGKLLIPLLFSSDSIRPTSSDAWQISTISIDCALSIHPQMLAVNEGLLVMGVSRGSAHPEVPSSSGRYSWLAASQNPHPSGPQDWSSYLMNHDDINAVLGSPRMAAHHNSVALIRKPSQQLQIAYAHNALPKTPADWELFSIATSATPEVPFNIIEGFDLISYRGRLAMLLSVGMQDPPFEDVNRVFLGQSIVAFPAAPADWKWHTALTGGRAASIVKLTEVHGRLLAGFGVQIGPAQFTPLLLRAWSEDPVSEADWQWQELEPGAAYSRFVLPIELGDGIGVAWHDANYVALSTTADPW